MSPSPTLTRQASPSPTSMQKSLFFSFKISFQTLASRSPARYPRSRDRFILSYDKIEFGDCRQRADKLLADFEDILLQVNADLRSKEESLNSSTPIGIQTESLSVDFTYVRPFV